jgi:hypothetical protein
MTFDGREVGLQAGIYCTTKELRGGVHEKLQGFLTKTTEKMCYFSQRMKIFGWVESIDAFTISN